MRFILRLVLFAALILVVAVFAGSCSRLPAVTAMSDLTAFTAAPVEWGALVAVTFAPQRDGELHWRELWFSNAETGAVTYVPVTVPDWKYLPTMVRTLPRGAASVAGGAS